MNFTKDELEFFLKQTSEIIAVLNSDGVILKANRTWGRPLEDIVGVRIYDLVPPQDVPHYKALFKKILIEEKAEQHFFPIVNAFGELITLATNMTYVDDLIYIRGHECTNEEQQLLNLRMMSKTAKIGAWYYNSELEYFVWSEECYRIYGLEPENKVTLEDVFYYCAPEYQTEIKHHFDKLLKDYLPFEYKAEIITINGTRKWINFKAENITEHGNQFFVSGIIADVTEQQNYLEKLRHNSETQKMALKGIKSALFDHDLTTDKVYYSLDFKKELGLPLKEKYIPESMFRKMIHPEDVDDAYQRHLDAIDADGFHYFNHYRLKNVKEGVYNHYEVHAYRKKDKKGKTIRMIGNLIDIEDKVQKKLSIEKYQRRLKAVINNGYVHTILLDTKGFILFLDDKTKGVIENEYGIEIEKDRTNFKDIFPKKFDERYKASFDKALKGKTVVKEINRIQPDGAEAWFEMTYTAIKDEEGKITGILINFFDITVRKKAELQIKEVKRKTEELSSLKSSILMNLSHEIRTPLNGIIGVNELLMRKQTPAERMELLKIQKESSDRLINTLEGMINLSQMDSLNSTLELKEIDVNKLMRERFESQKHFALHKKLDYQLRLHDTPLYIMGDNELFKVAIDNIINNAIKYTDIGKITIEVSQKDDFLKIVIADTGVGIKKKNLASVFEMFVQESQGLSRKFEGTGIGLTMSKKYVELMDGMIKVKSEVQKGSRFIIKFPLHLVEKDSNYKKMVV